LEKEKPAAFRPVSEIVQFAEILRPEDCEPPVLSRPIRQAIRQWMVEMNAEDVLAEYGLKARKTALLSGPPGCGKTTLAHHFAARLGLPMVLVNMASLIQSYVGATGRNINKLFAAVQAQQDLCLLFLDEFDSIATKRTSGKDPGGAGAERNSIVISLLQKIDSFKGNLIAATNRASDIDPAIWRRFGMHLEILEPDDESRFAILKRYLHPMALPDEALDLLVEATAGASPAVLRQLMEGLKRDVILSPRYDQECDARSVFSRLLVTVIPHASVTMPPLWRESWVLDSIAGMAWPPADARKK